MAERKTPEDTSRTPAPDAGDETGAEFLALSDCVWTKADPAASLAAFAKAEKAKA